jgi:hypothetical protein
MNASEIISTISAVLTAVYVVLTWFLNRHARESADVAKTSAASSEAAIAAALETARASQRAAEAAERSVAVSEAGTRVDFSARVETTGARTVVKLRSETASVHVFSIYVRLLVVPATNGSLREISSMTKIVNDEGQPVIFVHQGTDAMAVLEDPLSPGDTVMGHAMVRYGFVPELAGRERIVQIETQQVTSVA